MVELWFYSGRLGNCMFMYAFTKIISDILQVKANLPKGTEIQGFPLIAKESKLAKNHTDKYIWGDGFIENPKTKLSENDNIEWFIEDTFRGGKISGYHSMVKINDIIETPDVGKKWLVLLGNFELGKNYTPYRNKLKKWFKYPKVNLNKFEFFRLHPEFEEGGWFVEYKFDGITEKDIVISLRLEDYVNDQNKDRFLGFDYFRIILENTKYDRVFIITNPGSIGHNEHYRYLKEFYLYNPIIVRVYDPVMSMSFASKFNNIAISQSTYSWWLAFLSDAKNIYYPIPKVGPFSLCDENYKGCDLRVASKDFKYVDVESRIILNTDYYKYIDYENSKWKIS